MNLYRLYVSNIKSGLSSPDGSGILFLASLARKRYSGQQEIAPNFYNDLKTGKLFS